LAGKARAPVYSGDAASDPYPPGGPGQVAGAARGGHYEGGRVRPHPKHANRLRRRRGVSQSGLRKIEAIVHQSDRAVRRQFVAVDRWFLEGGRHAR